jgi:hypothetical protein
MLLIRSTTKSVMKLRNQKHLLELIRFKWRKNITGILNRSEINILVTDSIRFTDKHPRILPPTIFLSSTTWNETNLSFRIQLWSITVTEVHKQLHSTAKWITELITTWRWVKHFKCQHQKFIPHYSVRNVYRGTVHTGSSAAFYLTLKTQDFLSTAPSYKVNYQRNGI